MNEQMNKHKFTWLRRYFMIFFGIEKLEKIFSRRNIEIFPKMLAY